MIFGPGRRKIVLMRPNLQHLHLLQNISSGRVGVIPIDEAVVVVVRPSAGLLVVSVDHTTQTAAPAVTEDLGQVRVVDIVGTGKTDGPGKYKYSSQQTLAPLVTT